LFPSYPITVSRNVWAKDSLFSRRLIELLAELEAPVQQLEMLRNEFGGIVLDARSGVYDVICRDEHLWVFIVEMQKDAYKYLVPRLLFYAFHFFNSQVRQGDDGFRDIPPVYCICIVEEKIFPKEENYFWRFMFQDKSGTF
jgi:hypothetical protein